LYHSEEAEQKQYIKKEKINKTTQKKKTNESTGKFACVFTTYWQCGQGSLRQDWPSQSLATRPRREFHQRAG
jgi:hypothetical protein